MPNLCSTKGDFSEYRHCYIEELIWLIYWNILFELLIIRLLLDCSVHWPLREKCPNMEFFSGPYVFSRITTEYGENKDQKKFRIWTFFTQ